MGKFVPFADSDLDRSIVEQFESQVARVPAQVAVATENARLTYAELDAAANRVANALLERSGREPAPICLLFDEPIGLIAGMLGVLKAGQFYVVLDVNDPQARRQMIVEDAQPLLLVTNAKTREEAVRLTGSVLIVDDLNADSSRPGVRVSPDALLNLMYTSGSTGRPKGVIQTHRTLLHCIKTTHNRLRHTDADRMALLSPLTVGVSAAMLFAGLLIGATVLPFDVRRNGIQRLAAWLEEARITSVYGLPQVIRNTLALLPPGYQLPDLRYVKMGGDPVFRDDVRLYREHLRRDCTVQLTLGTTETYAITWWHLDLSQPPEVHPAVLPVGYAEDDSQVLILDDDDAPVPDGEIGEVVIRSRYLSPGYWHRTEATRAAYSDLNDGARQYRTGDLGRILPDGNLQHLGRKDFVVKVGGYLVSPVEVELALREIPLISDAAVVGRPDDAQRMRLIAYVASTGDLEIESLPNVLAERLPRHMLPNVFIPMEQLPRLPNGKLDARSLPSPGERARPFVAPRTPLEIALADIWRTVLNVEDVGIDDTFVDLGGDSLQAAQVLARASNAWGVDLPFEVLQTAPTVALLAETITVRLASDLDRAELYALLDQIEALSDSDAEATLAQSSAD